MQNRYELEQEIAILNKEKLHYFNKCQELEERKCKTCDSRTGCAYMRMAYVRGEDNFSCSLWSKQDD